MRCEDWQIRTLSLSSSRRFKMGLLFSFIFYYTPRHTPIHTHLPNLCCRNLGRDTECANSLVQSHDCMDFCRLALVVLTKLAQEWSLGFVISKIPASSVTVSFSLACKANIFRCWFLPRKLHLNWFIRYKDVAKFTPLLWKCDLVFFSLIFLSTELCAAILLASFFLLLFFLYPASSFWALPFLLCLVACLPITQGSWGLYSDPSSCCCCCRLEGSALEFCYQTRDCLELALEVSELCYHWLTTTTMEAFY